MVVLKLAVMLPQLTLRSPIINEWVSGVGAIILGQKYWFCVEMIEKLWRNRKLEWRGLQKFPGENIEEKQDYLAFSVVTTA